MKKLIVSIIVLCILASPIYAKMYNSLLIRDYVQVGSLIIESYDGLSFLNVTGNVNIGGSLNVHGSITINGAPVSSGGSSSGGTGNVVGPTSPTTVGAVALFTDTTGKAIKQSANNSVSGSPVTIDSSTNMSNVDNLTITGDLIIPITNSSLSQGAIIQSGVTVFHTFGNNTAVGNNALANFPASTTKPNSNNTACGQFALNSLTNGSNNTALGAEALRSETTDGSNTAIGYNSLPESQNNVGNTGVGFAALQTLTSGSGDNNIALGANAGNGFDTGSNNIYIGINPSATTQSNTTYIGGIYGTTTGSVTTHQVLVDMNGQLGTVSSSARYKKDIITMENIKAALIKLRPVRFRYKIHDDQTIPEYGLIAEEVAQVISDLVIYKDDQPETVKYHMLPAILIKAIQELALQKNKRREVIEELMQRIAVLEQAA